MQTDYNNLLEPPQTAGLFLRHPPRDFIVGTDLSGTPFFRTKFDLLTSLEKETALAIRRLPLFRLWSRLLLMPACFAGTTSTEYIPLPTDSPAEAVLNGVMAAGKNDSLIIIKDLPSSSPFLSPEENALADILAQKAIGRGFIELEGQALAYLPIDFTSMDQYLARLSRARRKDLRRKMKVRDALQIDVLPLGDPIFFDSKNLAEFYAGYLEVFAQSHIHFDLLTPDFFAALLQCRSMNGVVVRYRQQGLMIGYNICLIHDGRLIDKYIGFKYPQAKNANLYFISWLYNLQFALENKLHSYIAGWTDPEVKASLGASFTFTRHLIRVKNPLLRTLLRPFRSFFEGDRRALEAV